MLQGENLQSIFELKEKISQMANESSTFEKLAKYIEENFNKIIFMTATEVAINAKVSQGSVSRFCSSLGFVGYNNFLRFLQKLVKEEMTAPQRLRDTKKGNNSVQEIIDNEHDNIDKLIEIVNLPTYEELVNKLVSAKKIILVSARLSSTLLDYMFYTLKKIKDNVICASADSIEWNTIALNNPEDTLIFSIVFPRYPNILINKLKELNKLGFGITAITDSIACPINSYSDIVIQVPLTSASIFDVYSTPLLFINLLLKDVAKKMDGLDERLSKLEEYETQNNIYYKN